MAGGGPAIVEGALRLTQAIGIGQGAVGATIVSLGTGAEMIALGVSAARKKRSDILVSCDLTPILRQIICKNPPRINHGKPHAAS